MTNSAERSPDPTHAFTPNEQFVAKAVQALEGRSRTFSKFRKEDSTVGYLIAGEDGGCFFDTISEAAEFVRLPPDWQTHVRSAEEPVSGPPVCSNEGYAVVEEILTKLWQHGPAPDYVGGVETDAAYFVAELDGAGFRIVRVQDDDRQRDAEPIKAAVI